jgi:acyl-[acyl-carrier-protein] desaturase
MMAPDRAERNVLILMFTQTHSPEPTFPEIIIEPWTGEARQRAFDREVSEHCIEYYGRTMSFRKWSPWHNLPFAEMRQLGHQLSPETIDLLEGFLGIEEYVGDYVQEGLTVFHQNRTRRNFQLQWGTEEARHGVTWELVLNHSGVRTEEQLQSYLTKVQDSRWNRQQHAGLDDPVGAAAYAMFQERATYFHYQQIRRRIREEYGLSASPSQQEQERGFEIGASEACRLIALDEIAHHGLFLRIVQSAIKYFPSRTFDTLAKVVEGFEMPALRLIPNARAFFRAVRRANFYSAAIHQQEIHEPVLKALGLEDQLAFERAVQTASTLPTDQPPDRIALKRTGEWIVEGSTDRAHPVL